MHFLLILAGLLSIVSSDSINKDLVLKKVDRKIDISTQLVKISTKITLENAGSSVIKFFIYSFTDKEKQHMSFIGASSGNADLKIFDANLVQNPELSHVRIDLRSSLTAGKTTVVEVESVLSNMLTPYPASIHQGEKQLVEFDGSHYFLSPYVVTSQTTQVSMQSPNVISYTRLKPTAHVDTAINYGSYDNIQPFSQDSLRIHYENNSPFLVINRLERVIEISHWGNVAIEETIDLVHAGAKLKGSFSRYDYQREHNTYSAVKFFKTLLPAAARDVYYRDEIGNISTSNMRVQEDSVELDLRPRFPLFGGWKTHYTVGYNIPSYEYLFNSGNQYLLKQRFVDHIFDDMIIEEMELRVILPEGVTDIEFKVPYSAERQPDRKHYTYLDTVGRPVIVATKRNLVENHIQDFELSYKFSAFLMLQEPLLIVTAFLLMFLLIIMYVRLDLTLSKDESTETKMRLSSHCEMVHTHQDQRAQLYEKMEDEIHKLKTSKDIHGSQVASKKLVSSLKEESQAINDLQVKIKADSGEYADRVVELQKHDKSLLELILQQVSNVEKLAQGKISKQNYLEQDQTIHKKKEQAMDRVRAAIQAI